MNCASCGAAIPENSKYCGQCGAAVLIRCFACDYHNPASSKFCSNCGGTLVREDNASSAPKPAAAPTASDSAERRQLTVMFCDLVGSTTLSSQLDPEDLRTVIVAYAKCVADMTGQFGGFVARYVGDGVLVYFGYPHAHEDDPEQAIRGGLAVVDAVGRLRVRPGLTLAVRIGIATGLVVGDLVGGRAAQEQGSVVGETLNLAARLQSLAAPNTVVIAASTHDLVGTLFDFRDLGSIAVKGFADPVHAWEVLRASAVESRFEALRTKRTPLIGRQEEIELVMRHWQQAKKGEGRVVLLSGEPGIGKSRTIQAIQERIGNEPHIRLRYFCWPQHEDSALFPIISQLERAAGFERDDTDRQRLDKLATLLDQSTADIRNDAALLAELLSIESDDRFPRLDLSPQKRKEKTLAAVLSQFAGLAARQPVLIVFEDAHWADPTSRELLQQTVERVQTLPMLLIVTFRSEFQPPWIGLPHVTMHPLNRLSRSESVAMVHHLTGGKLLPDEAIQQTVDRAEGVPLFVEELTRTVLESGSLRDGVDRYTLDGPLPPLTIPDTLQASLLARLDRSAPLREVVQACAALGREFSYELLIAVLPLNERELAKVLDELTASGLLNQRGIAPQSSYKFKHALLQDAAYGTMLRGKRPALHARIAKAFEDRFPEMVDAQPELLAHHLARAGFTQRAISYWLKAAHQAMARGAAAEAVAQLRKGLELLAGGPNTPEHQWQEVDLQIALGGALMAAKGYAEPETDRTFARAKELCEQTGDMRQLMRVAWGQFTSLFAGGKQKLALGAAKDLLDSSKWLDDAAGRLMGHASVGASLVHLAEFAPARAQFEEALKIDATRDQEWAFLYGQSGRITALAYMSLDLLVLGFIEEARRCSEQSLQEARELTHPTSLCFANSVATRVRLVRRDQEAVTEHGAMVRRLAREQGLGLWQALGNIYWGWSRVEEGKPAEGIALMRQGLAQYRGTGAGLSLPLYLATLGMAHASMGNYTEALSNLAEAMQAGERAEEHWMDSEIHRLTGEVLVMRSRQDEARAETELTTALAVAQHQGAKLWEIRAATSLARLWRLHDRRDDARNLLAPVYEWFTEGFDAADLKDAKALLDELESRNSHSRP